MFGWLKSNNKQATTAQNLTVQLDIIKQPVAKTQAEKDVELMASDEWRGQLVEASETWNAKFDELKIIIAEMQEAKSIVALFVCAEFFNLSASLDETVLKSSYKNNLITKIEEILSIEKYRTHMIEKITKYYNTYIRSVDYYVNEFIILRNSYLNGVINVFKNYSKNAEIVVADRYELSRVFEKFKPESSKEGREEWLKYMYTYAHNKLIGISSINFYPVNHPLYNSKYFQYNNSSQSSNAAQLFAMQLYAMAALFEKNEQPSTTIVGIEFENSLREALFAEISDVVVETTPVTGDHGADLLIRVGSIRIAIQAKRYTGVVGNAAVQEIFAAKQFYDADFAMVVTTSRFTNPAKVLAEKLEVTLATESDFIQKIRRLLD